jgi:hypothetical protein
LGGDDTAATPGGTSSLYLPTSKDYNVLASVALLSFLMMQAIQAGVEWIRAPSLTFSGRRGSKTVWDFLDKLRKSGVTNMFDVRQTLRQAFPDLTTKQTAEVVAYWMHTFTTRAHKEAS